MNLETIQAYVTLIKDILTGLAALTAAIIGIIGLRTWRRELRGKTEYELAQRLLLVIYTVRDEVGRFRLPLSLGDGVGLNLLREKNEGTAASDFASSIYQSRWKPVESAVLKLDALSLEAETIWGNALTVNLLPFRKCLRTLNNSIHDYAYLLRQPRDPQYEEKVLEIIRDEPGNSENNEFSNDLTKAIHQIEDFLKSYLKI